MHSICCFGMTYNIQRETFGEENGALDASVFLGDNVSAHIAVQQGGLPSPAVSAMTYDHKVL